MLLRTTESGLYCDQGDFFVDPWRKVDRALITHAHADHARPGSASYLCAAPGEGVLRERLGQGINLQSLSYGETLDLKGVRVSFHPAGHVLGSSQIRLEHRGEVWVVSGDYKLQKDPTCTAFESIRCHTFISECTFGLPVYRWPDPETVMEEIEVWREQNAEQGILSVLFAYSLGKAQRLLAQLTDDGTPIFVHPSVAGLLPHYEAQGVNFPPYEVASKTLLKEADGKGLFLAPPAVADTNWFNGVGTVSSAFVSGWMLIRGARRRRGGGRGFVISDHADWKGLNEAIQASGAGRVLITHGQGAAMVRWLQEQGLEAGQLETQFKGESLSSGEDT